MLNTKRSQLENKTASKLNTVCLNKLLLKSPDHTSKSSDHC